VPLLPPALPWSLSLWETQAAWATCWLWEVGVRPRLTSPPPGSYTGTYWVLLGEHDITVSEGPEQFIPTEKIIVHPDYDDDASKGNDIALIKLLHSAEVTEEVQPACLAPRDYILPHGTECYITGWGTTSTGGSTPNILQQGLLPVVDYEHCSKPDWWGSTVKEIHVCAGGDEVAGCNVSQPTPVPALGPLYHLCGGGRRVFPTASWYQQDMGEFSAMQTALTLAPDPGSPDLGQPPSLMVLRRPQQHSRGHWHQDLPSHPRCVLKGP
uniref:Peptidase S1 domain-containing protein n=1 Tax=Oryctolagus cuniculus TaxID=9986 RepID=A0A5F9DCC4_RABIT